MPQQRGHGQQYGNNRHSQPDTLFSAVVGVFRTFFEFFNIHLFVLECVCI
jgi:hypothetical protein